MIVSGGVPLENVRLEIYENKKRLNMRTVFTQEQPLLLFNGPFFSWQTFAATCHMKIHGKVVVNAASESGYGEWGWAWNDGEAPEWCRLPCEKDNYFTNTVILVDGKKRTGSMLIWHKDADGTVRNPRYTARPGFGQKDIRFMYYVGSSGLSLPGLQGVFYNAGWQQGMMGDGGGSTMFKSREKEIYSSRIVPYFILLRLVDNEPKGEKPMEEINAYSKKTDGKKKLSSNFTVKEFACKDGSDAVLVAPRLVMVLQSIRSHFGKAVTISSAYRTPAYNAKVGGAAQSRYF